MGDGAVGTAAAVALSSSYRVILAGPPGTPEEETVHTVEGETDASFLHTGVDRVEEADCVVAALKAYVISDAVPYIAGFCRGPVICVSNGMGLEREWGSLSPRVEYAVLTSGFRKTGPFSVAASPGLLYCASGGAAESIFTGTFFRILPVNHIQETRWAKWYANSIINPLGAITGKPNNRLRNSELGWMIEPLEKELATMMPTGSSLALGREMLYWLLENSANVCSMRQDVESGLKTEVDYLTGFNLSCSKTGRSLSSELVSEIKRLS